MHFLGMVTALIVVFCIGFGLGTVHGIHDSFGELGYDRTDGGRMMRGEYGGERQMMRGDGGYYDQRVIIDETGTTTVQ